MALTLRSQMTWEGGRQGVRVVWGMVWGDEEFSSEACILFPTVAGEDV